MKKPLKKRVIKLVIILSMVLLFFGLTYALFHLIIAGRKTNKLSTGNLSLLLDDDNASEIALENAYPISDEEGAKTKEYTFTLSNNGTINTRYTIYLDDEELNGEERLEDSYVKYSLTKNEETTTQLLSTIGKNPNRILDYGIIEAGTTNTYSLRLWLDYNADNKAMGKTLITKLRVEATQDLSNKYISSSYVYNNKDNTCVTGEEETCKKNYCYLDKSKDSCVPGTIIKYKVSKNMEKYFYVIHDDGEKMTLQQRENTISNIQWYKEGSDATKGPQTVLNALENATVSWTNVEEQTYEAGKTIFAKNKYTGCDYSYNCTTNTYTLDARRAKARLITMQEVQAISKDKNWLYRGSNEYWLLNACSTKGYTNQAWKMYRWVI